MKTRIGFVSNSSSSSFILYNKKPTTFSKIGKRAKRIVNRVKDGLYVGENYQNVYLCHRDGSWIKKRVFLDYKKAIKTFGSEMHVWYASLPNRGDIEHIILVNSNKRYCYPSGCEWYKYLGCKVTVGEKKRNGEQRWIDKCVNPFPEAEYLGDILSQGEVIINLAKLSVSQWKKLLPGEFSNDTVFINMNEYEVEPPDDD